MAASQLWAKSCVPSKFAEIKCFPAGISAILPPILKNFKF